MAKVEGSGGVRVRVTLRARRQSYGVKPMYHIIKVFAPPLLSLNMIFFSPALPPALPHMHTLPEIQEQGHEMGYIMDAYTPVTSANTTPATTPGSTPPSGSECYHYRGPGGGGGKSPSMVSGTATTGYLVPLCLGM